MSSPPNNTATQNSNSETPQLLETKHRQPTPLKKYRLTFAQGEESPTTSIFRDYTNNLRLSDDIDISESLGIIHHSQHSMTLGDLQDTLYTATDNNWITTNFEQRNYQLQNTVISILDQTIDDWTMSENSQNSDVSTAYDSHDPLDNTDRLTNTAPVQHNFDTPEPVDFLTYDSHDPLEDPDRLTNKLTTGQDLPDNEDDTFDSHNPLDDPDRLESKPPIKQYLPCLDKPFFWIDSSPYYKKYGHDD